MVCVGRVVVPAPWFFVTKPSDSRGDIMTRNYANATSGDASGTLSSNVIATNQSRVACNGGGGPLGHPQIFLSLGADGKVICPYCSFVFVRAAD